MGRTLSARASRAVHALVRATIAVLATSAAMPGFAAAQLAARGDSLLVAGRPFDAEIVYYEAARLRPREPAARLALGRYLVARGASRVGAVLMEEARYFGGDAARVALELVPAYERLGDWKALAALPAPPLAADDRARATWLAEHEPSRSGPAEVTVPYTADPNNPLGRFTVRVGNVDVVVDVDASVHGLVLPSIVAADVRAGVRTFGAAGAHWAAVAAAVHADALTLGNLPVTVDRAARGARVGLDLLGALTPTFDAAGHRLTLRRTGRVAADLPGARLPTYLPRDGAFVVLSGTAVRLDSPRALAALSGGRWTWDGRRGSIVVGR